MDIRTLVAIDESLFIFQIDRLAKFRIQLALESLHSAVYGDQFSFKCLNLT